MDLVLEYCDEYAFDAAYAYLFPAPAGSSAHASASAGKLLSNGTSAAGAAAQQTIEVVSRYARDSIPRQCASLMFIALTAALVLYFLFCSLSYYFLYDRRLEHHPRFLKNQIRQEIISSLIAAPTIDLLTLPWFLGEVRGYSKLYNNVEDMGWGYFIFSAVWFLLFTDFLIYWIHRIEREYCGTIACRQLTVD
jgi:lathosterol oxidase